MGSRSQTKALEDNPTIIELRWQVARCRNEPDEDRPMGSCSVALNHDPYAIPNHFPLLFIHSVIDQSTGRSQMPSPAFNPSTKNSDKVCPRLFQL